MSTATVLSRDARKAETRRALIEAASELFARRGIDATSLDEVAAQVGLTKGAVYAHFPNKAQLVEEVLDAASAAVQGDPLVDPQLSLAERLANIGPEAAEVLRELPQRTILLNLEYLLFVMRDPGRHRTAVREVRRNRAKGGTELEEAARQRGDDLLVPGAELAAIIEAVGHGLANARAFDRKAFSDEAVERFLAALGYGLDNVDAVNELLSKRPST